MSDGSNKLNCNYDRCGPISYIPCLRVAPSCNTVYTLVCTPLGMYEGNTGSPQYVVLSWGDLESDTDIINRTFFRTGRLWLLKPRAEIENTFHS